MSRANDSDAGFGLIEAIVALAIASLALTALYRSLGGAVRAAASVQEYASAVVLARSHLDSLGSDGSLEPGATSGAYANGLQWRLNVASLTNLPPDVGSPFRPYWLILNVLDRNRRPLLTLETAKVTRLSP
jgi:prepilin-type N-terminal cleavage/methylation domain-containing protein